MHHVTWPRGSIKVQMLMKCVAHAQRLCVSSCRFFSTRHDDQSHDDPNRSFLRTCLLSRVRVNRYFKSLLVAKEEGRAPDFSELDRLITFANIANDECDYGQALKLGLDMFTMVELDGDTMNLLVPTYRSESEPTPFPFRGFNHSGDNVRTPHTLG